MPQPLCPSEGFSLLLFSSTFPLGLYKKTHEINKKRCDPIHQRGCFTRLSDDKRENAHHCDDAEERKRVSVLRSDCIPRSFPEGIPVLMSHHSSALPSAWLTPHAGAGGISSSEPPYLARHPASHRAPEHTPAKKAPLCLAELWTEKKPNHAANSPSLAQAFIGVFLSRPR